VTKTTSPDPSSATARRIAALAGNRILYRDGIPIAVHEGRWTRYLVDLAAAARWQGLAHTTLVPRPVVPELQAYLWKSWRRGRVVVYFCR
jgi:hypothetical protein